MGGNPILEKGRVLEVEVGGESGMVDGAETAGNASADRASDQVPKLPDALHYRRQRLVLLRTKAFPELHELSGLERPR